MKRSKGLLHRYLRNQKGFIAFEWTILTIVTLIIFVILLPDVIVTGKQIFHAHSASSYAIQRVAEQGRMTDELAQDVFDYMEARGIKECTKAESKDRTCFMLYGTAEQKGINSDDPTVEVMVSVIHKPILLSIYPNMRKDGISISKIEDGVHIQSRKVDTATPYIRG